MPSRLTKDTFLKLGQRFLRIHVPQLIGGDFVQQQVVLMLTDDHIAAPVALDLQQLREEPGREDAGVAPLSAVAKAHDVAGIAAVKVDQLRHAFTPQQRLVGHLKQQCVAGVQRR